MLGKLDEEHTLLEQLVVRSEFFEQVELLRRYGLPDRERLFASVQHDGIRSWFRTNDQLVVNRLIERFASPFGEYAQTSDRNGREDLRPRGSIARRLATIIVLAEAAGISIADWIPEAVDHVRQGWQLGVGDREDWLEIIRAARNPDSQEEHSWWLPDGHEEIARNLFESFVHVELDWIQFEAEDYGGAGLQLGPA